MNWYKLAFPITKKDRDMGYMDIGHPEENNNQKVSIWRIDENFNIVVYEEGPEADYYDKKTHTQLSILGNLPINYIAQGRYIASEHISSLFINPDAYGGWQNPNYRKMEYLLKKAEEIVDAKFNNPRIALFE